MLKSKVKPRKRWHNKRDIEHILAELREIAKARVISTLAIDDKDLSKLKSTFSCFVVRDCDLRATLPEKALSCHQHTKWTAFVNKAGTLIHLVPREGDFHNRIPLYSSVQHCNDKHIEYLMAQYAEGRLQ
jgi:hypothetical protein